MSHIDTAWWLVEEISYLWNTLKFPKKADGSHYKLTGKIKSDQALINMQMQVTDHYIHAWLLVFICHIPASTAQPKNAWSV